MHRCAILALAMILFRAGEPWFGTWVLDPAKSQAAAPFRFKRVISKIEPWDDGLKVTYDMVGIRGGTTHIEWTGRFDGKDYPVQGVDYVMTNAYFPIDGSRYKIVVKVDGATAATTEVSVAPDGKTLTAVTTENPKGATLTSTSVYNRR